MNEYLDVIEIILLGLFAITTLDGAQTYLTTTIRQISSYIERHPKRIPAYIILLWVIVEIVDIVI